MKYGPNCDRCSSNISDCWLTNYSVVRYYDPCHNRLIYIEERANEEYWDNHWDKMDTSALYKPKVSPFNLCVNTTRKYLQPGSVVLEGGAGLAQNSWYLHLTGYHTIALDFAPQTITYLKENRPEVRPVLGDVRNLALESESVDGYWSLGVIEHFYEGYTDILREMHRVIRLGGYLFLTFPHMSKLRRLKARRKHYEIWSGNERQLKNFYQFALDDNRVGDDFMKHDFELVSKSCFDGVKGLKSEIGYGRDWLQAVYSGRTPPAKIANRLMDLIFRPWTSHMALLVLKKGAGESAI